MGASPHDLTDNRQLATGNQGMLRELDAQFQSRRIIPDAAQQAAAERLQRLYDELVAFKHQRRSKLRKLLVNPPLPRGTYLWGGVGRGKSLLMDCFFDTVPYQRKRRVHFHAFMREVHERLRALKNEEDPLLKVADRIARETRLMCFDEFHVSDIADAMILGRLMEALFERGVVFCLTSNYPPDGLYPNGLQRHNFLPTITLLKERLDVLEVDGGIDYRLRALEKVEVFHVPADAEGEAKMEAAFREISGGEGHRRPVNILERELPVERRAIGVIWFDFPTLCMGPRSQNDYLEIARRYHTVFLSGVPRMTREMANEARRFTWLVDVFYDHKVKLVMTADCEAAGLYREGPQSGEFQRTVSRLVEMRSRDYLGAQHRAE
ncbi:MAG: AFG1 family ATPase [Rhodocyclaceae bacterium]|jgi:cell division protein ZapE|nr:AFG1 family ATPase [Rhodocyclaceae bacterium]